MKNCVHSKSLIEDILSSWQKNESKSFLYNLTCLPDSLRIPIRKNTCVIFSDNYII